MGSITNFLVTIIQAIYSVVHNHGWSIVLFTIIIRLILMPLDISSRKGMRKMSKIQPRINALQKKYANDKAKLQQKQSELMRKEGYNPLSGCLPLLIQMPILFAMFGAMRAIANEELVKQAFAFLEGGAPNYQGWLWVKNIWMPDSFFSSSAPDLKALQMIGQDVWQAVWTALSPDSQAAILANIGQHLTDFSGTLEFATADALKASLPSITGALTQMPAYLSEVAAVKGFEGINLFLFTLTVFVQHNGLLILPLAAGGSQVLMTMLNPQASGQQPAEKSGQQQPGMGNFMKYFFPLFSVYICLTSNAGFALYWVVSNLIASGMSYFINIYFDRKDKESAGLELQEGSIK